MPRSSRFRALLVGPDANAAASVEHHLKRSSPIKLVQVSWAPTLTGALEKMNGRHFDVALLDLSLANGEGWESFARLHQAAPNLPVVVIGNDVDDALATRVIRAGAEDYLVKEGVVSKDVARCLRHAVERHARQTPSNGNGLRSARRRGRVIGFIGAKGGVGTTTLAANVAAALAGPQRTVVAAELRSHFGTLRAHFTRTPPPGSRGGLFGKPVDSIDEQELNSHLWHYSTELALLPAPESVDNPKHLDAARARAIISGLAALAQTVVLDLPPEPSPANREAAAACHFLGLVVDREPGCLRSSEIMARRLSGWRLKAHVGLVVVHRTPLACPVDLGEITARTGLDIVEVIPPAPDACAMAAKAGVPLVESYDDSLVGSTIRNLAKAVAVEPIVMRPGL